MSKLFHRINRLLRLRFAVLYPLGIYLAGWTVPDDKIAPAGIGIMAAGALMRVWSNGYAIKLDKLTTSGPYALVRNPLYVGTGLILLGLVVMLKVFWVGIIAFAVIAAAYTRTIRNEEKMLTDKFGAAYMDYRARVPVLWPALRPYADGEKWPFSRERLWHSREHKVVLWLGIIVIVFYIKKTFMLHGIRMDMQVAGLIMAACLLGFLDAAGEYARSRQKKAGH